MGTSPCNDVGSCINDWKVAAVVLLQAVLGLPAGEQTQSSLVLQLVVVVVELKKRVVAAFRYILERRQRGRDVFDGR